MDETIYLDPAPEPSPGRETAIHRAALAGFPREQDRIAECLRVLDFYHLDGAKYVRRNDGDLGADRLPVETTGLTKRCVDVLTSRLYSPPPSRKILDDDAVSDWLDATYRNNLVNHLFQEADRLATLLGVAAFEAVPSDDPVKPVRLYLWDYSQLILLPAADDATAISDVVTIDRLDETTRYSWWSKDAKRTYTSKKAWTGLETSGGRATVYRPELSHVNPYGRLPFGLVHHALPVTAATVPGLGSFLADAEEAVDAKRYAISLGVKKYFLPKPYVSGISPEWQPTDIAGEYMRIPTPITGAGGEGTSPTVGFIQASIDVEQGEHHVDRAIERTLEAVGVPLSIYRMNQSSSLSGDALEAEQKPLIDYSTARQEIFKLWENHVAEATCAVGGFATGDGRLVEAGRGVNLSTTWPADLVVTSGDEQDRQDRASLELGLDSLVSVTMRRLRLTSEEEALQHLIKIREDNQKLRELGILPPLPVEDSPSPSPESPPEPTPEDEPVEAVQD